MEGVLCSTEEQGARWSDLQGFLHASLLLHLWDRARGESWCTTTRAIAGAVYLGRDFNRQTGKSSQRSRELKILRGKSGQVPFHDLL